MATRTFRIARDAVSTQDWPHSKVIARQRAGRIIAVVDGVYLTARRNVRKAQLAVESATSLGPKSAPRSLRPRCHARRALAASRRRAVLHQSHTSYPLICRARFRRSFDEMPSPIFLARQRSLCCRGSVKQQDDEFGISPRSGLSGHTCRQLAIVNTIRSEDSLMSVVPSIIVLVITALIVFRRELTTLSAAPASKPTPGVKLRPLRQSKPRLLPPA